LNQRVYSSDDPYDTPLDLRDFHHGKCKGQPAWIQPYRRWEPLGSVATNAEYERATWLNPDTDYQPRGRKGLHPGKRAPGGQTDLPPAGTWHVGLVREGLDWTSHAHPLKAEHRKLQRDATRITGIPAVVPPQRWSMIPEACYICGRRLDKPPLADKAKFCGPTCKRAADAKRKARKRRNKPDLRMSVLLP
jgi:hypothetical protein